MPDYLLGLLVGIALGVISTLVGVALEARLHRRTDDAAPSAPVFMLNPNWDDAFVLAFIREVPEGCSVIVQRRLPQSTSGVDLPDGGQKNG